MIEPASTNQIIRTGGPDRGANSPIRLLTVGLLVGAAYYIGSLIGFALTFPDSAVSVLWPPERDCLHRACCSCRFEDGG